MMRDRDHDVRVHPAQCRLFMLPQTSGERGCQLFRAGSFRPQAHVAKVRMVIAQSDDRLEMKAIIPTMDTSPARVDVRTDRRPAAQASVAGLVNDRVLAAAAEVRPDT